MNETARNCMCRLLASDDRHLFSLLLFDADAMVKVDFGRGWKDRTWFVSISAIPPVIVSRVPLSLHFMKLLGTLETAMDG